MDKAAFRDEPCWWHAQPDNPANKSADKKDDAETSRPDKEAFQLYCYAVNCPYEKDDR